MICERHNVFRWLPDDVTYIIISYWYDSIYQYWCECSRKLQERMVFDRESVIYASNFPNLKCVELIETHVNMKIPNIRKVKVKQVIIHYDQELLACFSVDNILCNTQDLYGSLPNENDYEKLESRYTRCDSCPKYYLSCYQLMVMPTDTLKVLSLNSVNTLTVPQIRAISKIPLVNLKCALKFDELNSSRLECLSCISAKGVFPVLHTAKFTSVTNVNLDNFPSLKSLCVGMGTRITASKTSPLEKLKGYPKDITFCKYTPCITTLYIYDIAYDLPSLPNLTNLRVHKLSNISPSTSIILSNLKILYVDNYYCDTIPPVHTFVCKTWSGKVNRHNKVVNVRHYVHTEGVALEKLICDTYEGPMECLLSIKEVSILK